MALAGVATIAFAGFVSATPALAFTHHPATPQEIQQTDALNAQALANAQMGTKPNQPTAVTTPNAMMPATAAPAPDSDTTAPDTATPPADTAPTPPPAPPSTNAPMQ
jgi:hypothetical protein